MDQLLRLDVENAVATVTFDNPPRGYMTAAQVAELDIVVDKIASDENIKAVIFTGGVPGVFVRHYDVSEIMDVAKTIRGGSYSEADLMASGARGNAISAVFDKVDRLPKPTIAAINGFAQGGGFEFALCCDIRLAESGDYRIGLPETNIGIFPGAGGTERLPRLIGEAKALELILRGRTVQPDEALALGMVHEVSPGDVLTRAKAVAAEMAVMPARGIAEAKGLVKRTGEKHLDEACGTARGRFSVLLREDSAAIEAMQRFLDEGEDINRR